MTAWASTGLKSLDEIICDLKKGDNVVWQADSIEDYRHFVMPFIKKFYHRINSIFLLWIKSLAFKR